MLYVKLIIISILLIQLGCSQASDDSGGLSQASPAVLSISPNNFNFNYSAPNTSVSHTFVLINNGGFNASSFSLIGATEPFKFKGNNFPGIGGNCPQIVPPGLSCEVVFEFTPQIADTFTETVQIQFLDGINVQTLDLNLQGNSGTPAIAPINIVLINPASSPGSNTTPTFRVSGGDVAASRTVALYTDSACTQSVASSTSSGSSIDLTSTALTDGLYTFYATTTNVFGLVSPCSTASASYELDTVAPNPQTLITHALTHDQSNTSPAISWTLSTSADVVSQKIGISENAVGGNDVAGWQSLPTAVTSYTFSGLFLQDCRDYYITLVATDDAGLESVNAVSVTPFQTDATDPSAPSGLSLSGTPTLIKTPALSFTNSSDTCGVASYEFAIGTTGTGSGLNDTMDWLDVGMPSVSYILESGVNGANFNLIPGGTYFVSMRAKDNSGRYSTETTASSFTVNSTFVLSEVTTYQDKIDFSWTSPITAGLTDYELYYKESASSTYNLFSDPVSTSTLMTLTGLNPSTSYDVYIMAKVGSVYVEYSNTLTSTTDTALVAPTSLVLFDPATSPGSDTTPTFTASGGSVSNGNIVKLFSDNSCSTEVGSATATSSSVNIDLDTALATDGSYTYYALVEDSGGYMSPCSTVSVDYELDTMAPNPQTLITHALTHDQSNTSPAISWTLSTSADVVSQKIGISENAVGGNDVAGWDSLTAAANSYTFSSLSLQDCRDYYVTLVATDDAGLESVNAVSVTPFQTDATDPSAPSGLSLSGGPTFTKAPTLSFSNSTDDCGIASYELAIGTTGSSAGLNDTMDWLDIGLPSVSYTLESGVDGASFSLVFNQDYYISIRAKDNSGNYSSEVTTVSWQLAITALSQITTQPDGIYLCDLNSQVFDCYIDNTTDGGGWLLVGRGRENWAWTEAGMGSPEDVTIDLPGGGSGSPGTVGATTFAPKYWSSAVVNDLLSGDSLNTSDVEVRMMRAKNSTGTSYQDYRWNINRTTWSWLFDTSFSFASDISIDGVYYSGGNTRDFYVTGNNDSRIFTWAWGGHASKKGFSYGSSVSFGSNSPTNFGWENGSENHSIPYTEVFIRINSAALPPVVQGAVITGQVLSVSSYGAGTSSADPHQWFANGVAISGATGVTYNVDAAQEGKVITLKVSDSSPSNSLNNWYPGDISLAGWYDPMDVASYSGSGVSFSINDKSGFSRHMDITAGTGASVIGNYMYFDGSGNLETTQVNAVNNTAYTILTVAKQDVANHTSYIIGAGASGSNQGLHIGKRSAGQFTIAHYGNDADFTHSYTLSETEVWVFKFNSPGSEGFVNGSSLGTNTRPNSNFVNTSTGLRLGAGFLVQDSMRFQGSVGDMIVLDNAVSNTDRQKIEGYLAHKYGLTGNLPGAHPYKTVAP